MNAAIVIAIVELVLRYGPRIASEMIKAFDSDEITLDQINSLLVKPPSHWLNDEESSN